MPHVSSPLWEALELQFLLIYYFLGRHIIFIKLKQEKALLIQILLKSTISVSGNTLYLSYMDTSVMRTIVVFALLETIQTLNCSNNLQFGLCTIFLDMPLQEKLSNVSKC